MKKSANKYYKNHETEFEPTQDQSKNVYEIMTELAHRIDNPIVKYVRVSNIDYCKFMFVCDNVFGTYLLDACRNKGYVLKHKFVSDSITVKRTKLTAKGANLIEKSNRGLIVLTQEEILAEHGTQTSYDEVVNYLDPRKWNISLSLPLAQCEYWQPWLLTVLSIDIVPELSDEDKVKLQKQLAAVNKRIDSQEPFAKKIDGTTPVKTKLESKKRFQKKVTPTLTEPEKKFVTKVFKIKKRGDNLE